MKADLLAMVPDGYDGSSLSSLKKPAYNPALGLESKEEEITV
jgi:hypothetical protein